MRVPTSTVSVVDLVATLKKETTKNDINKAFENASQGTLRGILEINYEPRVSIDYKGSPLSSIVDGLSTDVLDGRFVKVLAWYDNEWGYCCRLMDLLELMANHWK